MAKRQEIKQLQFVNGSSGISAPRYYKCPNGIVLLVAQMSRLLVNGLRKVIEKEMEDSKPKPKIHVVMEDGPYKGTEEEILDSEYYDRLDRWEVEVNQTTQERWPFHIVNRGVLAIGTVSAEILERFDDASFEEIEGSFEQWDGWQQEVDLYREQFGDLIEENENDKSLFVMHLCHDTQESMTPLYEAILNSRSIEDILSGFRHDKAVQGKAGRLAGVADKV